jgi:N-methylhydantoinase B
VLFGGLDPAHDPPRPFVHYETLGGGAGGGPDGPGASGIHVHMTNTLNTPIESIEQAFPVQIVRYSLGPPTEAQADEQPGGRGIIRRYRFLAPAEVSIISDRRETRPFGLHGAGPGEPGVNLLIRPGFDPLRLPGKTSLYVEAGDEIEVRTPSGGHWRPPGGEDRGEKARSDSTQGTKSQRGSPQR